MRRALFRTALILFTAAVILVMATAIRNALLDEAGDALAHDNDGRGAIGKLTPLANLGDGTAQWMLGHTYAVGMAGAPRNREKAIYWLRRAANGRWGSGMHQRFADQALHIARAYRDGSDGAPVDHREYREWLRIAAEEGNAEAARLLIGDTH